MSKGYIYILINPSISGLAKVGKTTRDPKDRVTELSAATGVPSPFILAYQHPVSDCNQAEILVHKELERKGFRHSTNREFFNAQLHEIINIIVGVCNCLGSEDAKIENGKNEQENNLAEELYDMAVQYRDGSDTVLKDEIKAFELFEQASRLNGTYAIWSLENVARYCLYGTNTGIKENHQKGIDSYMKLINSGEWENRALLAKFFASKGQRKSSENHWKLFFSEAIKNKDKIDGISMSVASYYHEVANNEINNCIDLETLREFWPVALDGIFKFLQMALEEEGVSDLAAQYCSRTVEYFDNLLEHF